MKTYTHQEHDVPTPVITDSFDSFYQEISNDWQKRARQLQQRRWKKLRMHDESKF